MKRLVRVCVFALLVSLASPAILAATPRLDPRDPVHRMSPLFAANSDGPVTMADNGHNLRLAVWAYRSGLEIDIAISQRIGATWSSPLLLGNGNGLADFAPDISFLPDGRPVVAWTQMDPTTRETQVAFSLLTASGWTAPERVNAEGTQAGSPHLVPSRDTLRIVFADASGELIQRAFTTEAGGENSGHSGSNGPDPMPNIQIPPEQDPNQFPLPRELVRD